MTNRSLQASYAAYRTEDGWWYAQVKKDFDGVYRRTGKYVNSIKDTIK